MTLSVQSPVSGRPVSLDQVPDPVFAQAMVGPGFAVEPDREAADVLSPITGTIVTLHPHAFVVAGADGGAVLVHLGIDTVKRKGEGFTAHVEKGDAVEAGQRVVTWNPAEVEAAGYAPICPVVALEADPSALSPTAPWGGHVDAGEPLFTWDR
ncbi:PTS glucose transporter subunit IIA [Actinosynnema pretiosum subsp. pretiosum]|uniref:PTS system, glucose subfamily, IIA subunit n=2 Tax=Actinosynnema TaxID=40566 RepID=C6W906_ACTMD|nr:PTS glucose transporter subunit IIA [Actinosynnema mirum]ACU39078.1 PTS system, glucose subfamily, IIA subunit [Actinosynnema mirum DSM 43827]AXX32674.1 PTS system, N-acetylglucosamine-specific IIA component [Actinosynnema pretiosum subsp. pretiosum]QUF03440.1 PTS glucose transporter subunit IIA [Actinosynnema pretiosum subsp. pretiosum]